MRYGNLRALLQDARSPWVSVCFHIHAPKCAHENTPAVQRASCITRLVYKDAHVFLCMSVHVCSHVFIHILPRSLSPPSLTSSASTAPLWQRLSKQNNLESFSGRPGNVNRLRRNITPTGVCGRLRAWVRERKRWRGRRRRGRWSVQAGVIERKREIGLMETERWKVKVWFPPCVCLCVCVCVCVLWGMQHFGEQGNSLCGNVLSS